MTAGRRFNGVMTAEEIRNLLSREPFEPFHLCLSSGEAYDICDPRSVALMKNRIFVAPPDGERWVFIAYLHIAATEGVGNGSTGRRGGQYRRARKGQERPHSGPEKPVRARFDAEPADFQDVQTGADTRCCWWALWRFCRPASRINGHSYSAAGSLLRFRAIQAYLPAMSVATAR